MTVSTADAEDGMSLDVPDDCDCGCEGAVVFFPHSASEEERPQGRTVQAAAWDG